eukprot:Gb_03138 [translate_table: standard]
MGFDLDPLQDFCIADLNNDCNGFVCKESDGGTVGAEHVAENRLASGGINPPHTHPRLSSHKSAGVVGGVDISFAEVRSIPMVLTPSTGLLGLPAATIASFVGRHTGYRGCAVKKSSRSSCQMIISAAKPMNITCPHKTSAKNINESVAIGMNFEASGHTPTETYYTPQRENRKRREIQGPSHRPLCLQEEEVVDHHVDLVVNMGYFSSRVKSNLYANPRLEIVCMATGALGEVGTIEAEEEEEADPNFMFHTYGEDMMDEEEM